MKYLYFILLTMTFSEIANSAAITKLQLTGGTYSLNGLPSSEIIIGAYADMTVGGYDGTAPLSSDFFPTSVAYTIAGCGCPMAILTTPYDQLNYDTNLPYRPLTGDLTDNKLTLDLDSWSVWRNGELLNSGTNEVCVTRDFITRCSSGEAETTYDAATGKFTADWASVYRGGPFNGLPNYWHIEGYVSAIPIPASVFLFASGFLGLAGMIRDRKVTRV